MKFSFILFLSLSFLSYGQQDTLNIKIKQNRSFVKKAIIPVSLIIGGSLISSSNLDVDIQKIIYNPNAKKFGTGIDDYMRYIPIIEMYTADALGIESKNHWFDQSKNLTISIIVSDFITFRLKNWVNKRRPNGGNILESFPSGHTSFAFTNAGVLFQEFKDTSPYLAYSGYVIATATGGFRVMNNAHWISDVMVGAGIGILVTELVYLFDPIIKWNPFKKIKGVSFIPQIDNDQYGFYLSKTF